LYSKKNDEAIASLAPLLALKTTDKARHPAVLLQARILVAASRYAEADALLDMLLKEKLERPVLYPAAYLAGEVNAELKDYAAAKASFRKVTGDGRAYPKNLVTEAWLGLGAAEEAELKWIEAGEAYEKALETADRPVLVERSVVRYLSAHAKA